MRKALVVGINYYGTLSPGSQLFGCVNDAHSVRTVLERHSDGTLNFHVKFLSASDASSAVLREQLRDGVEELFKGDSEVALLYFAGHGHIDAAGGYLLASDSNSGHDGLSLDEVLTFANASSARNKVLVLDSCHSGITGSPKALGDKAILSEGMTILTASSATQYAKEENGSGVFTALLVDALSGGAANLVGDVTPGSIYAHVDQSLGPWEQRPIFKTNVKTFTSLRKVQPPIQLSDLKQITELFKTPDEEFALDPSFEPQPPAPNHGVLPDPANTAKFSILQKLNRLNLVKPVDEDHMYFAAMNSRTCRLTVLGLHYWRLIDKGMI